VKGDFVDTVVPYAVFRSITVKSSLGIGFPSTPKGKGKGQGKGQGKGKGKGKGKG
jgi:hypothetical protein